MLPEGNIFYLSPQCDRKQAWNHLLKALLQVSVVGAVLLFAHLQRASRKGSSPGRSVFEAGSFFCQTIVSSLQTVEKLFFFFFVENSFFMFVLKLKIKKKGYRLTCYQSTVLMKIVNCKGGGKSHLCCSVRLQCSCQHIIT